MLMTGVKASSKDAERIEVIVRHATNGLEMKVALPAKAKFKHIKTAMARRLESDEILTRGQLINNAGGIYNAFKDNSRIGDVREVLALCVDMEPPDGEPMEASLDDGDVTEEDEMAKAVASTAPTAPPKSAAFDRDRAVSLQKELLQGFRARDFQDKLAALESKRSSMPSEAHFGKQRQELFLTVQSTVLPTYGFEGSQSGVHKMMGAMGPFIDDPEFVKLASEINRVIGLESPQESWAALSKSCRKVEDEPCDRQRNRQPVRARGLPGLLGGGLGGLGGLGGGFGTFASPAPMPIGVAPAPGANGSNGHARPLPSDGAGPAAATVGESGQAKPPPSAGTRPAGAAAGPRASPAAFTPEPRNGAQRPAAQRGPAAPPPPEPEPAAEDEDAPLFEPWPSDRPPPFKLFVAGSWNDYKPTPMQWQEGMFACPVTLGPEGCETFQLLLNGKWDRTFYPSMPDASALEEHTVCGPDSEGHGKNWQIGKYVEEDARPRARFVIIAGIDESGAVRLVSWQPVG